MNRYFEAFVGESPLLEFLLQLDGSPRDVSTGYTIALTAEDDADGTILTPVVCAADAEGANWANGVVTVRAAASTGPRRLLVALGVTKIADSVVTVVDGGVLVVRHRPGLADT